MKKNLVTIIVLILIILGSCIKTNKDNPQEGIIVKEKDDLEKDADIMPTLTINEIIENGIPNDTSEIEYGIRYENEEYSVIKDVIKPGEAISSILENYNLNTNSYALDQASKDIFDVRNIQSGKEYTVFCSKDSNNIAQCFVYHQSKKKYVVFDFRDSTNVYKGEKEITRKNITVSGTIEKGGSLWRCLDRKLESETAGKLVDVLANRIYAWTFDFTHIQPNDSFIVYFEEEYVNGESIDIGKIYAASFTHKGKTTNAFRFQEQENSLDYFDEKGNNLRSAFLVSPLSFTRVSSSFGKRKHPISGKWKNHNGTDYAAKTGTPVMTTASGTVTHSSSKGGYGNCVIVKHSEKFSTLYAHLSKFESGARKGSYVKQGDIIGYVGSTGYSTGPHLHYEFFLYGKQVDHLKQDLPPSLPLKKENTEAFEKIRDEYIKILDNFVK